jgi:putative transposase
MECVHSVPLFLVSICCMPHDCSMARPETPWPHAPLHQLCQSGTYLVTSSTYQKEHFFRGAERLAVLHRGLLTVARDFGWRLEAWAVFSNHYHFVGHSPDDKPDASNLSDMISVLHAKTSSWLGRVDKAPGRQMWFNFWETRLTYQKSYLTRLNYVHQNPVRHGLVLVANQYPWCSAAWFERTASPATVKAIYRFNTDRAHVADDFQPVGPW